MKIKISGIISLLAVCLFLLVQPARTENSDLRIYGFFDMEAEVSNEDDLGKIWTFDQHHLTIIAIYRIDKSFRVFTEVDYEHGPYHEDGLTEGEIYLAKSYLEYRFSDAFKIKVGRFLTPFGIYNERHDATPTFLTTKLPHSVYSGHDLAPGVEGWYYAKISTGIQILGQTYLGKWDFSYKGFVSNGRGTKPSERDENPNKGIGLRFTLQPPETDLKLGASFYTDRNGLAYDSRQQALGSDFEWDLGKLHFEGEVIRSDIERVDSAFNITGLTKKGWGSYLMAAYTIKERLTPVIRYEYQKHDTEHEEVERLILFGMNFAFNDNVYFKNEVHIHNFRQGDTNQHILFVTSLAVAF